MGMENRDEKAVSAENFQMENFQMEKKCIRREMLAIRDALTEE